MSKLSELQSTVHRLACGLRRGGHWYVEGRCVFCDPTPNLPAQNGPSRARNAGDADPAVRIRYGFIGSPPHGWATLPASVLRQAAGDEGANDAVLDVMESDPRHAVLYLRREHGIKAVPIDGRLAELGIA